MEAAAAASAARKSAASHPEPKTKSAAAAIRAAMRGSQSSPVQASSAPTITPVETPAVVALPSLDNWQLQRLREEDRRRNGKAGEPVREGVVRSVPPDARGVDIAGLDWHKAEGESGQLASFDVSSADARAMRVKLDLPSSEEPLFLRFIDKEGRASDTVAWQEVAQGTLSNWSPVLDGDRITVEIFSPNTAPVQHLQLAVDQIAHMYASAEAEPGAGQGMLKIASDNITGAASQCQYNASCINNGQPTAAYTAAENAVARINFISGPSAYLCSASLVGQNSTDRYLLTAAHCIHDAAAANTLSTRWFYQKTACTSTDDSHMANVGGGSDLLVTDQSKDITLLHMKTAVPAGVTPLTVQSAALGGGTRFIGIHHPGGDYKKVSEGRVNGTTNAYFTGITGPVKVYQVSWITGITAPGSSGSPMLAWNGSKYVVTGTLTGGLSSCTSTSGTDDYAVISDFYSQIASYMGSSPSPTPTPSPGPSPSPSPSPSPGVADGHYALSTSEGRMVIDYPMYFSNGKKVLPLALAKTAPTDRYATTKLMQVANIAGTSNVKLSMMGYPLALPVTAGEFAYTSLTSGTLNASDATTFTLESVGQLINGRTGYRVRAVTSGGAAICLGTGNLNTGSLLDQLLASRGSPTLGVINSIVSVACSSSNVLRVSFD